MKLEPCAIDTEFAEDLDDIACLVLLLAILCTSGIADQTLVITSTATLLTFAPGTFDSPSADDPICP